MFSASQGEELMEDWLSLGEPSLPGTDTHLKNEIDPQVSELIPESALTAFDIATHVYY